MAAQSPPASTTMAQSMPSCVGPDDFELIQVIGKGDVGTVYLTRLKGTDELYAMKVLNKKEMRQRKKVKRVFTEREILETANHPFIVRLYYSFQTKDDVYFVMEYCAGGEFFRTLQKQPEKRLPESVARFYASEVLLALEYLHALDFIYRDLKPENILLHGSGHIKLTDFDLSKSGKLVVRPDAPTALEPHFVTHSFVGTAEYISPEMLTGASHSGAVDWWTFGILIYEMLFGRTPFAGDNEEDTFASIASAELYFPREPGISKEARDLITRLLKPDPRKRLGARTGAAEIKTHPWFAPVKFQLIRQQTPPLVPKLKHPADTRYFRKIKLSAADKLSSKRQLSSPSIHDVDLAVGDEFREFHDVIRGPVPSPRASDTLACPTDSDSRSPSPSPSRSPSPSPTRTPSAPPSPRDASAPPSPRDASAPPSPRDASAPRPRKASAPPPPRKASAPPPRAVDSAPHGDAAETIIVVTPPSPRTTEQPGDRSPARSSSEEKSKTKKKKDGDKHHKHHKHHKRRSSKKKNLVSTSTSALTDLPPI